MKKKKKIGFWIVLGVFTHILTTIGTALAPVGIVFAIEASYLEFSYSRYSGYKKTPPSGSLKTINLEEYNRLMLPENTFRCKSFPESIVSGNISIILFSDPLFENERDKRGQVFLKWEMDSNSFFDELKRIQSVEGPYGATPLKSNNTFSIPSYIFVYNCFSEFEYVLIDEDSLTIFYIWFFDIESSNNALFPLEYFPTKVLKNTDIKCGPFQDHYNIYSFSKKQQQHFNSNYSNI